MEGRNRVTSSGMPVVSKLRNAGWDWVLHGEVDQLRHGGVQDGLSRHDA